MNANDITFGVEIETHIPAYDGTTPIGCYHGGVPVTWLPAGWKAEHDGSIHAGRGRRACEFISPILRGPEGLAQLLDALREIKAHGAKINASCGFHVTIGWAGDEEATDRLLILVANFEKALYAATGTKARERGRYCESVQQYENRYAAAEHVRMHRYHLINLTHLREENRRVEFRVFSASLNATKIVGYVRLCLAIAERAYKAKRVTKFVSARPVESSPIHRSGAGQTELTRLFYQIGWIHGRTKYTYGDVSADGAPTLRTIKRQLMRLARKYDSET